MEELARLKNVRGGHRSFVTRTIDEHQAGQRSATVTRTILESRSKILSDLTNEIVGKMADEAAITEEIEAHSAFEVKILECLSSLSSANDQHGGREGAVRLPKIQLQRFDGNIANWASFWERFEVTVDRNKGLADVEKLSYLLSMLDGAAKRVVQGLPLTGVNYVAAVQTLKQRFGNRQAIVNSHMERLFKVRPVQTCELRALRGFYDYVTIQIRSLESLGIEANSFDSLLLPLLLAKLPENLKLKLASRCKEEEWQLTHLLKVMEDEIKAREKCDVGSTESYGSTNRFGSSKWSSRVHDGTDRTKHVYGSHDRAGEYGSGTRPGQSASGVRRSAVSATTSTFFNKSSNVTCSLCGDASHIAKHCTKYKTLAARQAIIKQNALCFSCLTKGHMSRDCTRVCAFCKRKHHISICNDPKFDRKFARNERSHAPREHSDEREKPSMTVAALGQTDAILLQTARTRCRAPDGKTKNVNMLFDKGSQRTYITERLADEMHLLKIGVENCKINTFGSNDTRAVKSFLVVVPLETSSGLLSLHALTIPTVCQALNQRCDGNAGPNLRGIDVSNANVEGPIDILVGCDWYWKLVTGDIRNQYPGPVAMASKVGWLISGKTNEPPSTEVHSFLCQCKYEPFVYTQNDLPENDGDTVEAVPDHTMEEFVSDTFHNGRRYVVKLPWRQGLYLQNNNYSMAAGRLRILVKRLQQQGMLNAYQAVLSGYLEKGYIELVSDWSPQSYYLPHHGVLKQERTSSKLRIVFDGSAKVHGSLALNDCLYKGPSLITDLTTQLLHFRVGSIILLADIQEAFLQI